LQVQCARRERALAMGQFFAALINSLRRRSQQGSAQQARPHTPVALSSLDAATLENRSSPHGLEVVSPAGCEGPQTSRAGRLRPPPSSAGIPVSHPKAEEIPFEPG
jgi:hypothetical protein